MPLPLDLSAVAKQIRTAQDDAAQVPPFTSHLTFLGDAIVRWRSAEVGTGADVLGSPLAAAFAVHAGETWRTRLEGIDLPGLRVDFVA
jgi:hypothetical protein